MDEVTIITVHLLTLANQYEIKSQTLEEPRKAYMLGQAKGLLEAIDTIQEYEKFNVPEDSIVIIDPNEEPEDEQDTH